MLFFERKLVKDIPMAKNCKYRYKRFEYMDSFSVWADVTGICEDICFGFDNANSKHLGIRGNVNIDALGILEKRYVRSRGRASFAWLGQIGKDCGFACVHDPATPHRAAIYGMRATLDMVEGYINFAVLKGDYGKNFNLWSIGCLRMRDVVDQRMGWQCRELRVPLLSIQHRISQDFPDLRIMRPGGQQPGQAEVWLRPTTKSGILLGGCVMTESYYLSGHGQRDCLPEYIKNWELPTYDFALYAQAVLRGERRERALYKGGEAYPEDGRYDRFPDGFTGLREGHIEAG